MFSRNAFMVAGVLGGLMTAGAALAEMDSPPGTLVLDPQMTWTEGCGAPSLTPQWCTEDLSGGGLGFVVREPSHAAVINAGHALRLDADRTPILKMTYRAEGLRVSEGHRVVLAFFGGDAGNVPAVRIDDLTVDGRTHTLTLDLRERIPAAKRTAKALARLDLRNHASAEGPAILELLDLRFEPATDAPADSAADLPAPVRVKVVDVAGQPIAGATVRLDPHLLSPRTQTTTNDDGLATLTPTHAQARRSMQVTADDMMPFTFSDLSEVDADQTLQATLLPARTYAGRVLNEDGEPVADAIGVLWLDGLERFNTNGPGRPRVWVRQRVLTDEGGRWTSPLLPDSDQVSLQVRWLHPDYLLDRWGGHYSGKLSMSELHDGEATSLLRRGLRVEGRVTDLDGNPIAGALVAQGDDRVASNTPPDTYTDASGRYVFAHAPAEPLTLTVKAKGYGPELTQVSPKPGMEPVDVRLGPPGTFRIKVVDSAGEPLKGVSVYADTWRGARTLDHRFHTNAEGLAVWTNGPTDQVIFDIFTRGKLDERDRTVSPSTSESDVYVVTLGEPLHISATVTDATTGEPVEAFNVVTGILWNRGENEVPHWERQRGLTGRDGRWEQQFTHSYPLRVIRVEADGYAPANSEPIARDAGRVNLAFELERATSLTGRLVDASGRPVAGATMRLSTGRNMPYVRNGTVSHDRETLQATTDPDGRFTYPPQDEQFRLFVYTDDGFAEIDAAEFADAGNEVRLTPWARVEGVLHVGTRPGAGEQVGIFLQRPHDPQKPTPHHDLKVTADENGHFVFDRVPPGPASIGRYVSVGANSFGLSGSERIDVAPGETIDISLGGVGRPIIGRFVWPEGAKPQPLENGHRSLSTQIERAAVEALLPEGFTTWSVEERQAWSQSDEGKALQAKQQEMHANRKNFSFAMDADGRFRIDDVPAGTYELRLTAVEPAADGRGWGEPIANFHEVVEVPVLGAGVEAMDEPLDLGELEVAPVTPAVKVGEAAPALVAPVLDMSAADGEAALEKAKPFDLSEHRGKVVLIDFWAVWCGPCVAETPMLKAAWEAGKADPRFVMIGLSLDQAPQAPYAYFKKEELGWLNGFLGSWDQAKAPAAFGVRGIPSIWLIGPDGQVIAKDLRGPQIKAAVQKALRDLPPPSQASAG